MSRSATTATRPRRLPLLCALVVTTMTMTNMSILVGYVLAFDTKVTTSVEESDELSPMDAYHQRDNIASNQQRRRLRAISSLSHISTLFYKNSPNQPSTIIDSDEDDTVFVSPMDAYHHEESAEMIPQLRGNLRRRLRQISSKNSVSAPLSSDSDSEMLGPTMVRPALPQPSLPGQLFNAASVAINKYVGNAENESNNHSVEERRNYWDNILHDSEDVTMESPMDAFHTRRRLTKIVTGTPPISFTNSVNTNSATKANDNRFLSIFQPSMSGNDNRSLWIVIVCGTLAVLVALVMTICAIRELQTQCRRHSEKALLSSNNSIEATNDTFEDCSATSEDDVDWGTPENLDNNVMLGPTVDCSLYQANSHGLGYELPANCQLKVLGVIDEDNSGWTTVDSGPEDLEHRGEEPFSKMYKLIASLEKAHGHRIALKSAMKNGVGVSSNSSLGGHGGCCDASVVSTASSGASSLILFASSSVCSADQSELASPVVLHVVSTVHPPTTTFPGQDLHILPLSAHQSAAWEEFQHETSQVTWREADDDESSLRLKSQLSALSMAVKSDFRQILVNKRASVRVVIGELVEL